MSEKARTAPPLYLCPRRCPQPTDGLSTLYGVCRTCGAILAARRYEVVQGGKSP
jgi:hypothetical protein